MTHILLVVKTCLMHAHSDKATQAVHNYRFRALPTLCRSPTLTTDSYHYVIQNLNINWPDCVVSTNTNTTHQNRIDINTTLRVGYHVSLTAHISVRIRARVILKSVKFFSLVHISSCPLCIIALEWVQLPSMYDLSFLKLRGDHDSTFWSRTANANAQYVIENSKITAQPVCGKSPAGCSYLRSTPPCVQIYAAIGCLYTCKYLSGQRVFQRSSLRWLIAVLDYGM